MRTHVHTHIYMIRNGYACQDSFPSVPEGTKVLKHSAYMERQSVTERRGRVGGEEDKATKQVGHQNCKN